jgi:HSP20 family protein
MNLVPWDQFRNLEKFNKNASAFFDNFNLPFGVFGQESSNPKVDIYQNDKEVVLKAELPGVSKDDLEVYVDEDAIHLSGEMRRNEEFKENNVYRSERYYGSFSRTIALPAEVKSNEARAEYKDGILTLTVPKSDSGKARHRKVDIQ